METLVARGFSSAPLIRPCNLAPKNLQPFHCIKQTHFIRRHQLGFISGLRRFPILPLMSATSDDTSKGTTPYGKDELEADGSVIVEDSYPGDRKDDYDINRQPQEGSLIDMEIFKFMEDLNIKFDYQDTYSLLVFSGGGAVALWLATAVVGAIDSIPLLPKMLELIGFGYTIWFSSRYLIFKENRDELFSKVEQIKQEVIGSKDFK
ncbi:Protein CURVATURE THYLAKOID 1D- chloroplastic [Striga hermonthica]|uniref:Protein CURVATURE THYLAKOID 1D- chloroplastic n=1 Tax=Striga hermonthica TaxID=68872 RepID=A0A9N7NLB6_STRHE|nr:Protein CURVATURE THYLAKOID 1D- chloroplastic [Striga hermonthica]